MSRRLLTAWACLIATVVSVGAARPATAADVAAQTCASFSPGASVRSEALASFDAVAPRRLVDTRDGTGGVAQPIGAGCTLRIDVDVAAVPADAGAVALSVTALGSQPGFLTVFPCASGLPSTSNINTRSGGFPTPNLVVAIPDANRRVCISSLFEADVIVDLTGWWTEDGDHHLTTVAPVRAVDSREEPGRVPLAPDVTRTIPLASYIPVDATAVVGNLTVTEPEADGVMTVFPCGGPVPLASNLNFRAGESRAVAVTVGLGAGAELCVVSSTTAHVVFDVSGYYSSTQFGPIAGLQPLSGRRVADSRSGQGGWTGKFGAESTRRLRPTSGLPDDDESTAVVVNVIVTEAEGDGFVTLYPCGGDVPNSSAVNYTSAGESTNMVVVDLSSTGEICVFALTPAHVVVDLFGVVVAADGELVESLTLGSYTWPDYHRDATDYAVECTGTSTEIDLQLLRTTTARLNGVPVASGTVDLPITTDDRFHLELRRGSTVQSMSFRCVPDDFPRLAVERPGEPADGWYLTTVRTLGTGGGYAAVLDRFGAPVWYKFVPGDLSGVDRRSDGRLLMVQSLGPRYGVDPDSGFFVASLFGTVVDEVLTVPDPLEPGVVFPTDHHDFVSLPGGGRAMLSYPLLADQDLTVLGPGYRTDDEIADGVIQEIAADDTLLWRWRTSDHFGYDVSYPVRWGPLEGYDGDEVDVYHLNSLDRIGDGSGDFVVSARHMDNVFRVDRATGDVDWVLGEVPSDSPAATLAAQLTVVGDAQGGPRRPHDARLDGDVLTMFDNRTDTGEPARAVAYRIDTDAGTATLLWEIEQRSGLTSVGLGSTRITEAGTVVVSWGGGVQPVFGEYTTDGTPLIEITQVAGGNSYRIVKEPPEAFSRSLLRATAGGTIDVP